MAEPPTAGDRSASAAAAPRQVPAASDGPRATTCAVCGRVAGGTGVPLDWSTEAGARGFHAVCASCTRQHVRSIEGKLDAEHW